MNITPEPPDVVSLLQAVATTAARFEAELTSDSGVLRQGLYDVLRTYGLAAQMSEMIASHHAQIQALTDVTGMLLGRMIEHDRRSIHTGAAVKLMLELLQGMVPDSVAGIVADARVAILAELSAQLAELSAHERQTRDRLNADRELVQASEAAAES